MRPTSRGMTRRPVALHSPRSRQAPALLLLLHRRDAQSLFSVRSDVASISCSVYLNSHNWLASKLRSVNISYNLQDNAFAATDVWDKAPQFSDR